MSSSEVFTAIKDYLTASWTTTPISYENEEFAPPIANGVSGPWIAVEVSGTFYDQASIGSGTASANLWREEGQLWIHVYVATGSGSLVVRQYAKQIVDLFRGKSLLSDSLRFRDASIGMGHPGDEDGRYWGLSCSVDWQHDA